MGSLYEVRYKMDRMAMKIKTPPGKYGNFDFPDFKTQRCFGDVPSNKTCLRIMTSRIRECLCANCQEQVYENLARKIDPTYDPSVMHYWEECEVILRRLYGKLTDLEMPNAKNNLP